MPIMNSALNKLIESKSRATVLSINNLFGRLLLNYKIYLNNLLELLSGKIIKK